MEKQRDGIFKLSGTTMVGITSFFTQIFRIVAFLVGVPYLMYILYNTVRAICRIRNRYKTEDIKL